MILFKFIFLSEFELQNTEVIPNYCYTINGPDNLYLYFYQTDVFLYSRLIKNLKIFLLSQH